MIETKDLVEFMQQLAFQQDLPFAPEYRAEIVARLRAYDEMKSGIENMIKQICRDVNTARESNVIDK